MVFFSDKDLYAHFEKRFEEGIGCKNKTCDCLLILADVFAHKAVAHYLVWFERKSKHEQDCIVLSGTNIILLGKGYTEKGKPITSTTYHILMAI